MTPPNPPTEARADALARELKTARAATLILYGDDHATQVYRDLRAELAAAEARADGLVWEVATEREKFTMHTAEVNAWVSALANLLGVETTTVRDTCSAIYTEIEAAEARADGLVWERDNLIRAIADHVTVREEYFARATSAEASLTKLKSDMDEMGAAARDALPILDYEIKVMLSSYATVDTMDVEQIDDRAAYKQTKNMMRAAEALRSTLSRTEGDNWSEPRPYSDDGCERETTGPCAPSPLNVPVEEMRPEVLAFARLMEAQLKANDHKPGWKGEPVRPLYVRLEEEAFELKSELLTPGGPDAQAVGREAADVANFAMMIADVCGALRPQTQGDAS